MPQFVSLKKPAIKDINMFNLVSAQPNVMSYVADAGKEVGMQRVVKTVTAREFVIGCDLQQRGI